MIIKDRDSREEDIKELKRLLSLKDLTPKQKFLIERELYSILKGKDGEDDAAYYINFYYANSKNWAVIHDLRIQHNGRSVQIDHILINRCFDIYVLESKNYRYGIRITEQGEFEAIYGKHYIGIPSPIEQNKRHIKLLEELIREEDLLPRRLGFKIRPRFFNYVLISPKAIIKRPKNRKYRFPNVIKADQLTTTIERNAEEISDLDAVFCFMKISSFSVVEDFARRLVAYHSPIKIDWKRKFGIESNKDQKRYFCYRCGKNVSEKVAKFCWKNPVKFQGRVFCIECQKRI